MRRAAAAGTILALAASSAVVAVSAGSASAAEGFGGRADVSRSATTGAVTFVATEAGKPLAQPAGVTASSSPQEAARAFVGAHAADFGLGSRSTFASGRAEELPTGNTTVRLQQVLDGVEVLGGELAVQLDDANRVVSASGETLPESGTPVVGRTVVGEKQAVRSARAYVARGEGVKPSEVRSTYEGLKVFDSRILGGPVKPGAHTVHAVEVSYADHVRQQVFIDGQVGAVVASFDEIHAAKSRRVCDAGNAERQYPCESPVLTEGGSTSGHNADVVQAYTFSGATYDWFKTQFNRDSIDGRGMPLVSTVRFCPASEPCPFENAFWDGRQMTYGPGFAVADDVVAHELSHGVTERSSRLYYYYQSGAINESISDIFGELVDLATASPNDTAGDRWKLGESLPIGAIRDMANPNSFGDPASMTDSKYYAGTGDNGGVHINSGVGNKAAQLMVDGGSFNGQTVTGIGASKTAALFYEVNTGLLTSASDYQDLARGLRQACRNLTGTKGITAADCAQVDRAVKATKMDVPRRNAKDMRTCKKARFTFRDNLEKGGKKWRTQRPWFAPANPNPLRYDATYATSGTKNIWGFDRPGNWFPDSRNGKPRDYFIRTKKKVKVPKHKSSFLRFSHAYFFDNYRGRNFDGGRIEYSMNGKKWFDLYNGKYPQRIVKGSSAKLKGKRAFAGESGGYRTVVKKFPKRARGKKVFVRFRISSDATRNVYAFGWFIDDVGVGSCKAAGGKKGKNKKKRRRSLAAVRQG
ncbi:M4 family metallopeptidase [Nocardioides sp. Y6]|uniref:M4 family metallopeptidase n=2 Tax=Nocardioides malaquae TaxID=2773426 RepID=A0ABR9RRX2_9ACTN|nr:M4 family metallopeptidase [Nocardioides malaquae]